MLFCGPEITFDTRDLRVFSRREPIDDTSSIPAITAHLKQAGILTMPDAQDKLAEALRKSTGIFQRTSRGVYALRSWPTAQQRLPREVTP